MSDDSMNTNKRKKKEEKKHKHKKGTMRGNLKATYK